MNIWYCWVIFIIVFSVLFIQKKKRKKTIAVKFVQRKKVRGIMQELARRFIDKDCFINLLDGNADGIIREVTDGGIVIEKKGKQQIINLDYVTKIKEYPYNKKGKRESIVAE